MVSGTATVAGQSLRGHVEDRMNYYFNINKACESCQRSENSLTRQNNDNENTFQHFIVQ